jgi:AraC-like DNA-binding protein
MASTIPFWRLSLNHPPKLRYMATPVHGGIPIEIWRNLGFWCLHAYRYYADLRINNDWFEIRPGMVSILPPSCEQEYRYRGPSRHTYAHFDLRNQNSELDSALLPALVDLGSEFEAFDADFREAAAWLPAQPRRSQSRVWDLLWRLTSFSPGAQARRSTHILVNRAVEWIELRLDTPFTLAPLADELDISATHLIRLFRKHLNATPLAYVQKRRADKAYHLLVHTPVPIKAIARQVGLTNLQQLNKLMRKMTGKSPRTIRLEG